MTNGTRRRWRVSVTPRPLFTHGKDPVPIVSEAGWASEPVWTGAENLAPTGIRSPDRPARSSVAIPTELPGPRKQKRQVSNTRLHQRSAWNKFQFLGISGRLLISWSSFGFAVEESSWMPYTKQVALANYKSRKNNKTKRPEFLGYDCTSQLIR